MISIQKKARCCGCRSCEQACPYNCIEMQSDEEGFLYPKVNQEKCIGCNLCNKACPIEQVLLNKSTESEGTPSVFGGWYKDEEIRRESSSGGAFTLFAEEIIKNGGRVFGCTLDSDMKAVHVGVDNIDDLSALRGSKYVQSDIAETYVEVKDALKMGRQVLFVGTPCQAAGLYSFIGDNHDENLYIVDFICHGVPSPKVFADYVKAEERKKGSKLVAYRFRNKDKGWSQTGLQLGTLLEYADGTSIRRYPAFKDKYMNAFLDDVCLRPSCYECSFKSIPKDYADFTIADFWGVDKILDGLNDKKGTSLILVNTDHGMSLWNKVKEAFEYKEVVYEDAVKRNPPLVKSATLLPRREKFYADYQSKGYEYVEKKYMSAIIWGWHKALCILKVLWSRFGQFIKFGIVGCSNTIINLAVYYLCLYLGVHYLAAYTLGFLVSVCNAFFWNNKYVFKNKQEKSLFRAFIKVFASYGASFLLSVLLMSIIVEMLNISSVVAPILKMVITIPLNFVLNKVWAFKDKKG